MAVLNLNQYQITGMSQEETNNNLNILIEEIILEEKKW